MTLFLTLTHTLQLTLTHFPTIAHISTLNLLFPLTRDPVSHINTQTLQLTLTHLPTFAYASTQTPLLEARADTASSFCNSAAQPRT